MIFMSDQPRYSDLVNRSAQMSGKAANVLKKIDLSLRVEPFDVRFSEDGGKAYSKKLRKAHGLGLINKAKSYTGGGRKAPSPMGHYDLLKRKLVKKHQKKQTQVG